MSMNQQLVACAILALGMAVPAFADAEITEARLGKRVVERKIADETDTFDARDRAYLWLRVEGTDDEMLTVTWKVNDLAYPVELKINGSPWRTWASKTLHIVGAWSVTVTDSGGQTLHQSSFTVR